MIFTTMNDKAQNGARIHTCITLLLPADDEKFPDRPWRSDSSVNGHKLATSHHETRADATATAERMHRAYLEVHAG